jgi:hypothetical protein|tara:strand:- start:217 stop:363 length:147 start_codon:yes stop_codon:yes gene_type:complete
LTAAARPTDVARARHPEISAIWVCVNEADNGFQCYALTVPTVKLEHPA